MKILFLTSEGFDTPNSINHLSMTLIDDLLNAGINVHMISSHKTGTYDDIPDILTNRVGFTYEIIQRRKINKNNFIIRYIDEISYALKARKYWNKSKNDIDAVLLQSNPNSVYMAILLKFFMRKPIVYNLYDVFPGHAYDIGVIKSKLVYGIFKRIQRLLYRLCDYIVVISEDMKKILIKEGVNSKKIVIIYNWFDTEKLKCIPFKDNRIVKKFKLPNDRFYIQYAGLLGYVLDYKMILNVADTLREYEDIIFLIIGDGNVKEEFLNALSKMDLNNVWYFPWQPIELISDLYNACDIGFIPLKRGVIGNGVPSKAWQLMACKKPILNSVEVSEYHELFNDLNMGISINNDDPQAVADAILDLYNHKDRLMVMGENAWKYVHANYNRDINTSKFIKLFKGMIRE